jgi:uncharacterized membrane protein (UPF0127 family)
VKLFKGKKLLLKNITTASGLFGRFMGLMGKKSIPADYAMYFPACNSIHTYFMKMPIDVIMLDSKGRVVFTRESMMPWKIAACFRAKDTIEMRSGNVRRLGLAIGDILTAKNRS